MSEPVAPVPRTKMRILFSVLSRGRQGVNLGSDCSACRYHVSHQAVVYVEIRVSNTEAMFVAYQPDSGLRAIWNIIWASSRQYRVS